MHRGLWPSGRGKVSLPLSPRACTPVTPMVSYLPTGLAGCSVGPGLVVVRVSWLGHPELKKKDSYIHVLFFFFF